MKFRSWWSAVLGLCLGLGCLLGGVAAGQGQTISDEKHPIGGEEGSATGEPTEAVGAPKPSEGAVPRWVRFSGLVREKDAGGEVGSSAPHRDVVGITFALYKEQEGGAPLWMEVQNVKLNSQGRYTVLLGSTHPEGLPMDIFSSAEAQWLGVQVEGQEEQPRVLLVSVPYALKAAEAETLGGKSVSEFVLAKPSKQPQPSTQDATTAGGSSQQASGDAVTAYVTTNSFIPKFINCGISCQVDDSVMFQNGSGFIGVNTTTPLTRFHLRSDPGLETMILEVNNSSPGNAGLGIRNPTQSWAVGLRSDLSHAFNIRNVSGGFDAMVISTAGNVGIGTSTPNRRLQLVGQSDLQLASFESSVDGNAGFGFKNPVQNWGVGLRFDLAEAFVIRNITSGQDSFVLTPSGALGLGVTSPTARLHLDGSLKISGGGNGIVFPDSSTMTTAVVDTNSGGTVTSVAAGTGLIASPAPILGAGTLSIDTAVVPRLNAVNTFTANQIISNARLGVGTASPDASVLLHVKNFADNGGRIRVGGNAVDNSGPIRRISIGDGDFIYLGESPTVDDTLEIRAFRVHMVTSLVGINVATPTNILQVQQGSSTDPIADAWTVYSSRRWKKNIQTLDHALAKVERLRGVSYESKLESKPEIGLIAEEVGEVIPELVTYEENGTDATSVDYARLTALLVEAVKEQQAQIRDLKTELGTRAREYRELRAEMQRLKAASQSRTVHKRSDDAATVGR